MKNINNKGFTLIELIAIIVVLVAIFLVAFPSLLGTTKQDEEKLYTSMVDDLCLAGETYIYSHMDEFPELSTPGETFNVYISKLIEYGNVSKNKENPKTGEVINNHKMIFTVLEDNSLECQYSDESILLNDYIVDLYTPNDTVVNTGIIYDIDTNNQLIDDGLGMSYSEGGNIRYYGSNPENYIDIGDRDSDGNIIFWRIIGVFKDIQVTDEIGNITGTDDLVKIIRSDSIGNYAWDNKSNGIGSSTTDYGSNDWTDARLMMLLNPGYEETSDVYSYEGSLYWNSKSGTCYISANNGSTSCDFTSMGISTTARNKVESVVWNLGGYSSESIYSNEYYYYERETNVYGERPTKWVGKVGLMYPSDYGYATDFTKCSETLNDYNGSANSYTCRTNDWLFTNENQWTITPYINESSVSQVYDEGEIRKSANMNSGIRPVLYLKSDVILTGTGQTEDGIRYYIVE